jgi:hypothetical protein
MPDLEHINACRGVENANLWYPFWTDKTPRLDDSRTCAAEPVDEPYFNIRRDDCLLVLKTIPGSNFNDLHRDPFPSCGRIGVIPHHGNRGSQKKGARGSQHGPRRAESRSSYSKRHAH